MSEVHIRFKSTTGSGLVIGEIWPAFAETSFERHSFTAYYGQDAGFWQIFLPSGDYWVRGKLPRGGVLQELVSVPEQVEVVEVCLQVPDLPKRGDFGNSTFAVVAPGQSRTQPTNRPPRPHVEETGLSTSPALPDSYPKLRGMKSAFDDFYAAQFKVRQFQNLSDDDGYPLLLKSHFENKYSLKRVHAKFLKWPRPPYVLGKSPSSRFMPPDYYFLSTLRYADPVDAAPMIADGDVIRMDIPPIPSEAFRRTPRDIKDERFMRDLVVIKDEDGNPEMVATIPNGWSHESATLRITTNRKGGRKPLKVSIEVKDPIFNALLQFMQGGDLSAAVQVVESSVGILYAKFDNPYAAAAAGYVLMQAAPDTLRVPWELWIGNLARRFESLPDGGILHSTLLLQRSDADTLNGKVLSLDNSDYFPQSERDRYALAAKLVLDALGKGPPLYRAGLGLLASNILILRSLPLPEDIQQKLSEADKLITWLSMRVDPTEPFSVFYLKD